MIRCLKLCCCSLMLLSLGCTQTQWVAQHVGDATQGHTIVSEANIEDANQLSPQQAVVLDPNLMFGISNCAMGSHTDYAWTQGIDKHLRFVVAWPNHRHVWIASNLLPIDPQVYPVMVMTYRANQTVQPRFWDYHVAFTDDRHSGGHAMRPDNPEFESPLVTDGQLREYRVDLRTCNVGPKNTETFQGKITTFWVGTRSGMKVPATFDLVGMRFESTQQTRPQTVYGDDAPIEVRIVDQTGLPVANAKVTVDAQRVNFARSVITNAEGYAKITPLKNEVNQHMLRVEKEGFVTTEFFKVVPIAKEARELHISKAVVFRGTIVDDRGKGISNVAVRMYPANRFASSSGGQTRTRVAVKTDSDGRWASPPLPVEVTNMCLRFTHPDYVSDNHAEIKPGHNAQEMALSYPVAVMHDGVAYHSQVLPAEGLTLENLNVVLVTDQGDMSKLPAVVDEQGKFKFFTIALQSGQIFITAQNHEPMILDFNASTDALPATVQLKPGRHLTGQITYPAGMSARFERLLLRFGNKQQFQIASSKLDDHGQWEFDQAPANVPLILHGMLNGQLVKLADIGPDDLQMQITAPTH